MFDFLIDIVPREEFKAAKEAKEASSKSTAAAIAGGGPGGIEHRRSQESFQVAATGGGPMGSAGNAVGGGGPVGLEGYGYPYGMLENGQFAMVSHCSSILDFFFLRHQENSGLCIFCIFWALLLV